MKRLRALWISLLVLATASSPGLALPAPGDPAPSLVLPLLDGGTFDLAQSRGKVVIVHYWATWCAPCREEMPVLDTVYGKYHGRGLDIIAISLDHSRDRDSVEKAMQGLHYPASILAQGGDNGFGKPSVLPVTIVIGRDGQVRTLLTPNTSPLSDATLSAVILPLLDMAPRP